MELAFLALDQRMVVRVFIRQRRSPCRLVAAAQGFSLSPCYRYRGSQSRLKNAGMNVEDVALFPYHLATSPRLPPSGLDGSAGGP